MDGRPAVRPVADVGRDAFRAGGGDQSWYEAMLVALAVHGWGERNDRRSHSSQYEHRVIRCLPIEVSGGHERLACAFERRPHRLDGTQIRLHGGCMVRDVVPKCQVNDTFGSGGTALKAVEVVKGTAMHLGPRFLQRLSPLV